MRPSSFFMFPGIRIRIFFLTMGIISTLRGQFVPADSPLVAPGAKLQLVADDFDFTEGPAADASGNVFFTDQPNDAIYEWSATDNSITRFMGPAGRANGLFFDREGNLWAAADAQNQLWKIAGDKAVTVVVDDFEGKRLNGPNDLWIDPKGGIYFTDPFYLRSYWAHNNQEIKAQRVYYLPPHATRPVIAADGFVRPNGIIGTPDGSMLYVADIGDGKTYVYQIGPEGHLSHRKRFTTLGSDGMTIDHLGNVYLTGDGVNVFNASGMRILHLPVPERWTANVTFGGATGNVLFITAMDSVYTLEMNVHGAR